MKPTSFLLFVFLVSSCVPVKVAPRFKNKDYKIMQAKKFKRKLPRETSFIFKDPKAEGQIHDYFDTKYGKQRTYGDEFLIKIENQDYYLSYYEKDKEDQTLNLAPVIIDKALDTDILQDAYTSRKGHWYILITVRDKALKNCLLDKHPKKELIKDYLVSLKKEYLETHNYQEILFKKKP